MSRRATPMPKVAPRPAVPDAAAARSAAIVERGRPDSGGGSQTGSGAFDPLLAFSRGLIARDEAIRLLGLRDYAGLLVALGDADLPMPLPTPEEIEAQASTFVTLWNKP